MRFLQLLIRQISVKMPVNPLRLGIYKIFNTAMVFEQKLQAVAVFELNKIEAS